MCTDRRTGAAIVLLILSLIGFLVALTNIDTMVANIVAFAAIALTAIGGIMLIRGVTEYGFSAIGKKFLIVSGAAVVILAFFLVRVVSANAKIAAIANDFGREYGVTDFTSRSASANGQVWNIELYSDDFANLSEEDQFKLMVSIGASERTRGTLVEEQQKPSIRLLGARFVICSDRTYKVYTNDDTDIIGISGTGRGAKMSYSEEGIAAHGYGTKFSNDYGSSGTKCAHPGCTGKIASSGDTNCCVLHSNQCGNCGCYIDEDALFCMDCLRGALE